MKVIITEILISIEPKSIKNMEKGEFGGISHHNLTLC